MTERVSILLVDDQRLVREGLRRLLELEPDFEVVGMAESGEDALTQLEHFYRTGTSPDVILLDIRMPGLDGLSTAKRMRELQANTSIVFLTTFDDTELIQAGLQTGAQGYLLKDSTPQTLAQTVRLAAQRQVLLQPEIARKAFSPAPSPRSAASPTVHMYSEPLSRRELDILTLLAQGISNRAIAERLYLREGTVKNYVSNIISKLGVQDRTQAALRARELGFVSSETGPDARFSL